MESNEQVQERRQEQVDVQEYDTFLYKFQQQIISAWKPVPHVSSNVILYLILSIICIGLGLALVLSAPSSQEITMRYDNICPLDPTYSKTYNAACVLTFTLTDTLYAPIYMYYGLVGFHQNHRRYIKFYSDAQLTSGTLSSDDAQSSCGNFVTNSQASYTKNVAGVALAPNAIAFPCGTIGRAYNKLKDEIKGFRILNPSANMEFSIVKTGIAWPSDIGRHKNYDLSLQPFSVTEEEWLVWFRPAAQSTFYKLNGIIQADMPAGTYTVKFLNHMPAPFGEKWFSLSKSNFVGSRDLFLGIAFLVLGAGCFFLLIVFFAKWINEKRGHPKIE